MACSPAEAMWPGPIMIGAAPLASTLVGAGGFLLTLSLGPVSSGSGTEPVMSGLALP